MPVGVVTTQPDRSPMFAHHAVVDGTLRATPSTALSRVPA